MCTLALMKLWEKLMSIEKVLYTVYAKATGGRDGRAVSSDGVIGRETRKTSGAGRLRRVGHEPLSSYLRPATQRALSER